MLFLFWRETWELGTKPCTRYGTFASTFKTSTEAIYLLKKVISHRPKSVERKIDCLTEKHGKAMEGINICEII